MLTEKPSTEIQAETATTRKIEQFMAVCCLVVLAVFTLQSISNGYLLLIVSQMVLMASLFSYIIASLQNSLVAAHIMTALISLDFLIVVTIYYYGLPGAYWAFPAIISSNLVGTRRTGIVLTITLILAIPAVLWMQGVGFNMLTRLFGALVLTAIFAWYSATKAQELHDRLIKESTIDPLTGCFNRRHLTRFTRQFIPSQSFLILIDVDDFKGVNDTCGHYTGDIVLKAIARLIQEELSESDLLFRIGGEEFLVFESQAISAGTSDLAERIRACIDTTAILPTRHITVSIGETLLSHHETFESALQCADKSLYLSKINGRNRVTRA